ncbi:MAG: hypothetical protein AAGB31_14080 [Bdellovibrio sp.]
MNKRSPQFQLLIFLIPACFGAWAAFVLPRFEIFGSLVITIGIVGGVAIIWAKLSEKQRTRKIVRWGFAQMTIAERVLYVSGYGMLLLSIAVLTLYRSGVM